MRDIIELLTLGDICRANGDIRLVVRFESQVDTGFRTVDLDESVVDCGEKAGFEPGWHRYVTKIKPDG